MRLVIDANILFSALIKDGKIAELLVNNMGELYAPDFLLEEFKKHKKELLGKTKRSNQEFEFIFGLLKQMIISVPFSDYATFLPRAAEISPDPDDVPYLALALKLEIPLWSDDKKLKQQSHVRVYCTRELL